MTPKSGRGKENNLEAAGISFDHLKGPQTVEQKEESKKYRRAVQETMEEVLLKMVDMFIDMDEEASRLTLMV